MSDIEIEIDGKICQAKPNAMVIQVADDAGIYIPRFCYHKHLSIAANCRMCLVEVEKAPKPMPACATPVMPGMKVFTRSAKALAAQKAVMEFLLINHPLDCPICDQGGECELQDLSMGYGSATSFYHEGKRSVEDQDLGPLIATEMTRCILCTRCVRFGDEVAGLRELGVTNRGENDRIEMYLEQSIKSEVSGNVIDLCPVGALTSKPFRFTARAWELNQFPSLAAHDCLGSNINVHARYGEVMRVVPRENNAINLTWISDRDRFSYQGLYHADRLEKPRIRVDGHWQDTDWETALDVAIGRLQQVMSQYGVEQFGALASPNATLEEFYLLQKLLRSLGTDNIDHRLRQVDFSDQQSFGMIPGTSESIADLDTADAIFLLGSNIQKEQPIAGVRVRKAALAGAAVVALNMIDYDFHFNVAEKEIVAPDELPLALARIAKALGVSDAGLQSVEVNAKAQAIAAHLREKKSIKILLGALALNHPQAATIRSLAAAIASVTQATVVYLTEGANAAGAWVSGAIPHRGMGGKNLVKSGLDAQAMLREKLKAYLLLNVEPDLDCANPVIAIEALREAKLVIALSVFKNPVLEQYAHVILPIGPFTETSGTYVNAAGTWQSFAGAASATGESRPAWKVLRVLGNWLKLPNFEYQSSEEVLDEVTKFVAGSSATPQLRDSLAEFAKITEDKMFRIGEVPAYSGDSLVRRAEALQATQAIVEGSLSAVRLHSESARKLQCTAGQVVDVMQGKDKVSLPVVIDDRVPLRAAFIANALPSTSGLSELFGEIQIITKREV
jgi:NADH-quinone oxidoreductase subunit G